MNRKSNRNYRNRNKNRGTRQQTKHSETFIEEKVQKVKLYIFLPLEHQTVEHLKRDYEIIISYQDPNTSCMPNRAK